MRTRVQSLASFSRLRIWGYREQRCRSQLQLQCDPLDWELPYDAGAALKKENEAPTRSSHWSKRGSAASLEHLRERTARPAGQLGLGHHQKARKEVPVVAQWLTNPTRIREVEGSIPGHAQWVNDLALL